MRALVLSGGGVKGAYQAGAIAHLVGDRNIPYDLVCGVSVGAINAAYLAQYPVNLLPAVAQEAAWGLIELWKGIRTKHIRRHWLPFSFLQGFFKGSLYSSAPLRKMLNKTLDPKRVLDSGRQLKIGAVSLTDGRYRFWHEYSPDLTQGVLASSSFPVALEYVNARKHLWTDGGTRNITPLKAAIDAGATDVDVVLTFTGSKGSMSDQKPNLWERGRRELNIMINEIQENDLKICGLVNDLIDAGADKEKKKINLRIIRPTRHLPINPLKVDPKQVELAIWRGRDDAREAVG